MYSNYPDGMTGRDWDYVYGIVRCQECGHPISDREESQCEKCLDCSYCCTGGVTYRENLKKDLCDKCYEQEEDGLHG